MKTFKDLIFEEQEFYPHANQAVMWFPNGYGVSVLCGDAVYSNGVETYEIAIMTDNNIEEIFGYRTEEEISEIMREVQEREKI